MCVKALEAGLTMDLGRGAGLLLPLDPTQGGEEVMTVGINEALEAEI